MMVYTNDAGAQYASEAWCAAEDLPEAWRGERLTRVEHDGSVIFDRGESAAIEHEQTVPRLPEAAPSLPAAVSTWEHQVVDESARTRIEAQHAALIAAGVRVNAGEQLYATGTRMTTSGYSTQASRKAEHDRSLLLRDAAEALANQVRAERREDITLSAAEFARGLDVNGKVTWNGRAVTETAIRGLAVRLESPMLGYVLGLRDRMAADYIACAPTSQANEEEIYATRERIAQDRRMIAEVLQHECRRNADAEIKLRTRREPHDVFAVVSPGYAPADAPEAVDRLLADLRGTLPADARGSWDYDAERTAWELRASVWTPTPVDEQSVGEPFSGYVSFQSRDNGTSSFRGGGGIELIRCLNASVYLAEGTSARRRHTGRVTADILSMLRVSTSAIGALCAAWGTAREQAIEVPSTVKIGDVIPGFWRSLLRTDRDLSGVLAGRRETHVEQLTKAFAAERREPDRIVRADFAQGWTRYIQDMPGDDRRDAEAAIGSWMVRAAPMAWNEATARA